MLLGYPPLRDKRKDAYKKEIGTLVLLILFGLLAAFIPGLRCAFLVMILLISLIPWFIYVRIRIYAPDTVGRLWWFL